MAGSSQLFVADAQTSSTVTFDDQMRQPWTPPSTPPFLRNWLICGPFPNVPKSTGQDGLTTLRDGIETNFLSTEATEGAAQPTAETRESLSSGGQASWTAYSSPTDSVDLTHVFSGQETSNRVAYAYSTLTKSTAEDVLMTVGSDDAVRVWLNGEPVHTNIVGRGVSPDNDIIGVHLNQGVNTVLVKVVNAGGGWGFALRFVHPADLGQTAFRPWVAAETAEHKIVVTTAVGRIDEVPVDVAIVAAGGKVIDHQRSTLGAPVTFDAGS